MPSFSTACGKINFKRVTFFSAQETAIQPTTKNHQLTTNSPQKTIQKTTIFPAPPSKKPAKPQKIRPVYL
jgi:hypothetical protein